MVGSYGNERYVIVADDCFIGGRHEGGEVGVLGRERVAKREVKG